MRIESEEVRNGAKKKYYGTLITMCTLQNVLQYAYALNKKSQQNKMK